MLVEQEGPTQHLYDFQRPHALRLLRSLREEGVCLDASDTGTGKTYVALALCSALGCERPLVVCPLSVVGSWRRAAKEVGLRDLRLAHYEMICKKGRAWTGDHELERVFCTKRGVFTEPAPGVVVFDEAHRAKNKGTRPSRVVFAARDSGSRVVLVTSTACDKQSALRNYGAVLRLFPESGFEAWLNEQENPARSMHRALFPRFASRLRLSEVGQYLPRHTVVSKGVVLGEPREGSAYARLLKEEKPHVTHLREQIEHEKLPIFRDLVAKHLEAGKSVVVMLNFKRPLRLLADMFLCPVVTGDQDPRERQQLVADFQANRTRLLLLTLQTGGTGISLHDTAGGFPRVAIISPPWSGQDLTQALGRTFRLGCRSEVVQYLVYCTDTFERRVCEVIREKLKNLATVNEGASSRSVFHLVEEDVPKKRQREEEDLLVEKLLLLELKGGAVW